MVTESKDTPARVSAREINETIRYTTWTALHQVAPVKNAGQASVSFESLIERLAEQDIELRGAYDVSALRADAELMLWFHAPSAELIQVALRQFAKTELGEAFTPVWSAMGLHRPAEFNKGHVPAFMSGAEAKDWVCVYPFVRSYEWYLLPEEERRAMLIEHGMAGRDFKGILSNTVSSFALGDYEWLLALESNDLHEIVDMMRELRATKARMHVREEIPFYTGRKIDNDKIGELFA
jgi:peroxiredoxin